jgi:hypothetical protein
MQGGTSDAVDTVLVKHISGGISELAFKSYGKGREKWQAAKLDLSLVRRGMPKMDVYHRGV